MVKIDLITGFYKVGRNVYTFSVYKYMLVVNNLTSFFSCSCKSHTENNIVKSSF